MQLRFRSRLGHASEAMAVHPRCSVWGASCNSPFASAARRQAAPWSSACRMHREARTLTSMGIHIFRGAGA